MADARTGADHYTGYVRWCYSFGASPSMHRCITTLQRDTHACVQDLA